MKLLKYIFIYLLTSTICAGGIPFKLSKGSEILRDSQYEVALKSIGQIRTLYKLGASKCSAVIIGKRHILSAAHCFIDHSSKQRATRMEFYADLIEGQVNLKHIYKIEKVFIPKEYENRNISANFDFAIAQLAEDISTNYKPLEVNFSFIPVINNRIHILGYPSNKPIATLWGSECSIALQKNPQVFYNNCFSSTGVSGAPVLVKRDGRFEIIGVHSGASQFKEGVLKHSVLLDPTNESRIKNWIDGNTDDDVTIINNIFDDYIEILREGL